MNTPLTKVSGIGPSTAKDLEREKILSVEELAAASLEQIMAVPGFGAIRAERIKAAAAAALTAEETPDAPVAKQDEAAPAEAKAETKGKKEEKDKKKKGKKEKKPEKKKEKKGKKKK